MFDLYERTKELCKTDIYHKVIGHSVLSRDIIAFGAPRPTLCLVGGIHGREHLATAVLLECISQLNHDDTAIFEHISVIPLLNPDGVDISMFGTRNVSRETKLRILAICPEEKLKNWKANVRGVDLNVNFPIGWGRGHGNVRVPSAESCIGELPLSEPESTALYEYLKDTSPQYVLFLHSRGEVVYWGYDGSFPRVHDAILVSSILGFPLCCSAGSHGGMKDWYTAQYPDRLSLTIELGRDDTATNKYDYDSIYFDLPRYSRNIVRISKQIARTLYPSF